MKIKVNPAKPFYFNKHNHKIRCGNFPLTGKELIFDNDLMINFFNELNDFVSIDLIVDKYSNLFNVDRREIESSIEYLLNENFLITDDDYDELLSNKKFNRENLFFYMVSNKIKNLDKINGKKIGVLGLGGIGCNSLEMLARSGFKEFFILDCDLVDESNLIRQSTYFNKDIGKSKVDIMEKYLKNIDSDIKVSKFEKYISNIEDIPIDFTKVDIIICTIDKPYRIIRRVVNNFCVNNNIPVIFAGFAEHVGMVGPFIVPNETACLMCIEKKSQDLALNNVKIVPSYGPLCNIISSILCNEIINYFISFNKINLKGCTLMFDIMNYKIKKIKWKKKKNCKVCGDKNDSK
jgi:molybdopterin-synthase adenylyltransferase